MGRRDKQVTIITDGEDDSIFGQAASPNLDSRVNPSRTEL